VLRRVSGSRIELRVGDPPRLGADDAGQVFRIAQEALQNALRHAGAARIVLRLEPSPDRVRLTIQDDGRGFAIGDAAAGDAASRFGLVGMRERARLLGGSFQIESSPGTGVRITAEVPLPHRSRV
jgi:signal transduction histidine kinase